MAWLEYQRRPADIHQIFQPKICIYWTFTRMYMSWKQRKEMLASGLLNYVDHCRRWIACSYEITRSVWNLCTACTDVTKRVAIPQYYTAAFPRSSVERLFSSAQTSIIPSLIVSLRISCYVPTLITRHTNYWKRALAFLMSSPGSLKLYNYRTNLTNFRNSTRKVSNSSIISMVF
jgi:hypothetical protein